MFWLSIDYTASTASIFNLSILSLDRYWSITSPLRYLRRRTKKRALIMILTAWIGASMWFIPVLGWNQITRKGPSQLPGKRFFISHFPPFYSKRFSNTARDTCLVVYPPFLLEIGFWKRKQKYNKSGFLNSIWDGLLLFFSFTASVHSIYLP